MSQNFWFFILTTVAVSLSGVMLPGPLTAATIASGYRNKNAGLLIGIGHGIVEVPIIALIYFDFAAYLSIPIVRQVTGIAGGLLLITMGLMLLIKFKNPVDSMDKLSYNPLITGILMTGGNPYFLLWWATVGITLITSAISFGIFGLLVFIILHLACDIGWDQILSLTVYKTKHLWSQNVQKTIFGICAVVLIGFGIYFGVSVFLNA
jgi:threonine/homoserine/homoserine lactone efflux protein